MSETEKKEISISVNNHNFFDDNNHNEFSNVNDKDSQKILNDIYSSEFQSLYLKKDNENLFKQLIIYRFRKTFKDDDNDKLIYQVEKNNDNKYFVKTGLYTGYINIQQKATIVINSGYDNIFWERMLNYVGNIYFYNNSENISSNKQTSSKLIIEYLFLTSFKSAIAFSLPTTYTRHHETSIKFKGKLDINKFISKDIFHPGNISYIFLNKEFDQDIIDVLYLAFASIKKEKIDSILKSGLGYLNILKTYYSGKKISKEKLINITNNKSLSNPNFIRYKKVVEYAKLILEYKYLMDNQNKKSDGISGFLVDISELWEIYLYKLLKNRFNDLVISSQECLQLYKNAFFHRKIYPDIVIETNNKVIVIDAKFKKMKFKPQDVDRADFYQIHSYISYYKAKNKNKTCYGLLIYPINSECNNINNITNLYGLDEEQSKFGIEYIRIGTNLDNLKKEENNFLDRIAKIIDD